MANGPVITSDGLFQATNGMEGVFRERLKANMESLRLAAVDELTAMLAKAYVAGVRDGWNQGLIHAGLAAASTRTQGES